MASVKIYKGERGKTTYQITIYKGYIGGKQVKDTVTYTLEEMGINPVSDKGNPRSESTILRDVQLYADNLEKISKCTNYTKGDKIKFADFYENTWKPWAENHYKASSYYTYRGHIEKIFIPDIGSMKIGKISNEHLDKLYLKLANQGGDKAKKGYARKSIIAFNKNLASVMNLAVRYKIISENPCMKVLIPRVNSEEKIKYFTKEEAMKFLDILENPSPSIVKAFYKDWGKEKVSVYQFTSRKFTDLQYDTYKVLFRIALFSGCRIGELLALSWRDIDFDSNTLHITKSVIYAPDKGGKVISDPKTENSVRDVVIPDGEIRLLVKLKKNQKKNMMILGSEWLGERELRKLDDNLVFPTIQGKIIGESQVNRVLRRLLVNYNATVVESERLPVISTHGLRHTSATLLIAGDMDIKTVSSRLGHKNIQTTLNIYAHPLQEKDKMASDVLGNMLNADTRIG